MKLPKPSVITSTLAIFVAAPTISSGEAGEGLGGSHETILVETPDHNGLSPDLDSSQILAQGTWDDVGFDYTDPVLMAEAVQQTYEGCTRFEMDVRVDEHHLMTPEAAADISSALDKGVFAKTISVRASVIMEPKKIRLDLYDLEGAPIASISGINGDMREWHPSFDLSKGNKLGHLDSYSLTMTDNLVGGQILATRFELAADGQKTVGQTHYDVDGSILLETAPQDPNQAEPQSCGAVQESGPVFLEYTSVDKSGERIPTGTERIVLPLNANGCQVGSLLNTWVGSTSNKGMSFANGIRNSQYMGQQNIDGVLCALFARLQPIVDETGLRFIDHHIYAVGPDFLIRKHKEQQGQDRSDALIVRDRSYTILAAEFNNGVVADTEKWEHHLDFRPEEAYRHGPGMLANKLRGLESSDGDGKNRSMETTATVNPGLGE